MTASRVDDTQGALFDLAPEAPAEQDLIDRYLVPPFTVLDRRQGYWQQRAGRWKALGIESELGRDGKGGAWATIGSLVDDERNAEKHKDVKADLAERKREAMRNGDRALLERLEKEDKGTGYAGLGTLTDGMSIFDPVLCEVSYSWFCKQGGSVLDPFAGGSVRGVVCGKGSRAYTGIDLSKAQVEANERQAERIFAVGKGTAPTWINGDSREVLQRAGQLGAGFDFIFTCPPYGNLEIYSDDPADLSNMPDDEFDEAYMEIIGRAVGLLRNDRFAACVVGNYRDKRGTLRDLVGLTVRAFEFVGASYYNEAIIIDPVGTMAVRAPRVFSAARKLVKGHQQLLVFVKGDPKVATDGIRADHERNK
jgi:hypothetical protein